MNSSRTDDLRASDPAVAADEPLSGTDVDQAAEPPGRGRRVWWVRNASLTVLAVLGCVYTLHWAKAVFIPLLLGLMASYALTPVVDALERLRLPRVLAAGLLLSAIVGGLGLTAYHLSDDANEMMAALPEVAQKFREAVQKRRGQPVASADPIETVQIAAEELEKVARDGIGSSGGAKPGRGPLRVQIEEPVFRVQDHLWSGTLGLAAAIGQAVIVVFLAFFLLVAGNTFRRKMVRIVGPRLSDKKLTVQALDEITDQIQRYLLVQVGLGLTVAFATWLCFWGLGVQQAGVWALMAGLLNLVPYLGAVVFTGASAAVGLVQFGNLESALMLAGVSLGLRVVSGYLLAPWVMSQANRMNPVTVFVGVLAWGWLWGAWGLLLAVPILVIVKAVCDHTKGLKGVGELLGN